MRPKPTILLVDDEPQIIRVLKTGLVSRGYDVRTATNGREALDLFAAWPTDLVVTDLTMPAMGGLELCRRLREVSSVPIVVLSVRGEERIKVEALDAGADDYVTKPFGIDELLARVRAVLRRAAADAPAASSASATTIDAGDFHVNLESRAVTVGGKAVRLTPKEYDLLLYFVRNAGKVIPHGQLLTAVWGARSTEQVEYLRVFVGNVRKKIEADPAHPRYLLTEPWVGYRFDAGGE